MNDKEDNNMQFEQLQKDMIAAMKARDKVRKDAISALFPLRKRWQSTRDAGMISRKNW